MDSTMETVDDDYNAEDDTHPAVLIESATRKCKHNTRGNHRCRKCGKAYALPQWAPFHLNKVAEKSD